MAAPMERLFFSQRLVSRCLSLKCEIGLANKLTGCVRCVQTRTDQQDGASLAHHFRVASVQRQQAKDPKNPHGLCRTSESDPRKHNSLHGGLFYTVPEAESKRWLQNSFHRNYYRLAKAFNETSIMIREPALDIMKYMKAANYEFPAIRYILHGKCGSGKTTSLSHLLHYCGKQNWLIIHIPWAAFWNRYYKEVQPSTHKAGRFDLPLDAAEWLAYFRQMNEPLLKDIQAVTQNRYVWNKREACEVGTPWVEAIDFALGRPKYASDVVGLVLKETKLLANSGKIKALVAVDGVNSFWQKTLERREEDINKRIHAEELSLVHNFKKILRNDWTGGAVVCTVDVNASMERDNLKSDMPRFLLEKEGFEFFEPHIPVHVADYTEKEFQSCLEYYKDRRWIQNPRGYSEAGKEEIQFLSCNNPRRVYEVTRTW